MPRFGKKHFHPFSLSVFKMNDILNFEDNFLFNFSGYKNKNFHSRSVLQILFCLVSIKGLFSTIFTQWFKGKLFRYY